MRAPRAGGPADERVLQLDRALQETRLELAERDRLVEWLRGELARARDAADDDVRRQARADVERLVEAIGAPLAQVVTLEHLHRTGSAEVQVADAIGVGTRLVRSLAREGVETVGTVGAVEPFDPDRHDPLSASVVARAGQQVVVRVVGLSYLGRVLRKAGVETVER